VREDRVLVYSTDGTLPLPAPSRGATRKTQPTQRAMPNDGVVRVAREKRRNSAVTVVHGLAAAELDALGKDLKRLCGTGGTAKNGVVELQAITATRSSRTSKSATARSNARAADAAPRAMGQPGIVKLTVFAPAWRSELSFDAFACTTRTFLKLLRVAA